MRGIGRRGHHELVRVAPDGQTLLPQLQPLVHPEAMLLVDDREREPMELDALLEERVRADGDLRIARGQRLRERVAGTARVPAGEQRDADTERLEPCREVARVLLGEELRRRHHRGLAAVFGSAHGRQRSDHGLAGAHVALHQPHHRV